MKSLHIFMLTVEIRITNTHVFTFFVWNKYAVFEKEKSEYYRPNGKIQLCPNIISKEFLKNNRTKYILKKKAFTLGYYNEEKVFQMWTNEVQSNEYLICIIYQSAFRNQSYILHKHNVH